MRQCVGIKWALRWSPGRSCSAEWQVLIGQFSGGEALEAAGGLEGCGRLVMMPSVLGKGCPVLLSAERRADVSKWGEGPPEDMLSLEYFRTFCVRDSGGALLTRTANNIVSSMGSHCYLSSAKRVQGCVSLSASQTLHLDAPSQNAEAPVHFPSQALRRTSRLWVLATRRYTQWAVRPLLGKPIVLLPAPL